MVKRCFVTLTILFILCLTTISCDIPNPKARVRVIDWEQDYYTFLGGWSDLVEVWYEIENTGNVDIDYYKIWFRAKCSDGSDYEDWTNGIGLDVGRTMTDSMFISVPRKKVLSVSVVDYELDTWQ